MSEKSWLSFLLKMVVIVLDALMDYLKGENGDPEKKGPAVGG